MQFDVSIAAGNWAQNIFIIARLEKFIPHSLANKAKMNDGYDCWYDCISGSSFLTRSDFCVIA